MVWLLVALQRVHQVSIRGIIDQDPVPGLDEAEIGATQVAGEEGGKEQNIAKSKK